MVAGSSIVMVNIRLSAVPALKLFGFSMSARVGLNRR
jgi:hypothetical protein